MSISQGFVIVLLKIAIPANDAKTRKQSLSCLRRFAVRFGRLYQISAVFRLIKNFRVVHKPLIDQYSLLIGLQYRTSDFRMGNDKHYRISPNS